MHVVVLITASKKIEAQKIARGLLKEKLAACVNIVDKVHSLFWWQGKIDNAGELLLVVKTRKDKLKPLIKKVKSLHSYTVPEIIALPIAAGYGPYLKWIDESLR
jgi:periplasmic divalent cation tolerance protein